MKTHVGRQVHLLSLHITLQIRLTPQNRFSRYGFLTILWPRALAKSSAAFLKEFLIKFWFWYILSHLADFWNFSHLLLAYQFGPCFTQLPVTENFAWFLCFLHIPISYFYRNVKIQLPPSSLLWTNMKHSTTVEKGIKFIPFSLQNSVVQMQKYKKTENTTTTSLLWNFLSVILCCHVFCLTVC